MDLKQNKTARKTQFLLNHLFDNETINPLINKMFGDFYVSINNPRNWQENVFYSDITSQYASMILIESDYDGIESTLVNQFALKEYKKQSADFISDPDTLMHKVSIAFKNFQMNHGETITCKVLIIVYDINKKKLIVSTAGIPFTRISDGSFEIHPEDYSGNVSSLNSGKHETFSFTPIKGDKYFFHTLNYLKKLRGDNTIRNDQQKLQDIIKTINETSFEKQLQEINYLKKYSNSDSDAFGVIGMQF